MDVSLNSPRPSVRPPARRNSVRVIYASLSTRVGRKLIYCIGSSITRTSASRNQIVIECAQTFEKVQRLYENIITRRRSSFRRR